MLRKVPLIVILGSTGTGKTKLSLELAERFGGEIISADSMQVYANLDIVTAKATKEERAKVKHHLLDVATPYEPFTVTHFRNQALPIINNLLNEGKSPIIVGGTNYYIEALLWDILISNPTDGGPHMKINSDSSEENAAMSDNNANTTTSENSENWLFITESEMLTMSSELLYNHLKKIDPVTAQRIHPNNKRKIMRAIQYYQDSGQTLSFKINEQRQQPGGNRLGGPLRYPQAILLWLKCNQDILNRRLEKRIDSMLEGGLLREIRGFYNEHNPNKNLFNAGNNLYTKGVLQTIGFKEFIPYLEQFDAANDEQIEAYLKTNEYKMPTEGAMNVSAGGGSETQLPVGLSTLNTCLNELKLVTRRYSKKQQKWINNRLLACTDRDVPDIYELDTGDVNQWQNNVYRRAVTIIDCYLMGDYCEMKPLKKRIHPGAGLNQEISNYCTICERQFIGEYQWYLHLNSNKHKKRKESKKKREKLEMVEKDDSKVGSTQ
ncbi:tRNA dimethylallyltransferase [Glossina fuscipes]|uniref:tRNA dimethylallyltransferase n=1 Tax=Glossina fuscipes TaxID=7396 RepID=A0A8U0W7V1_9MUSC|nr:tRNA dimethylallyltransferase [Glossina fuscipes]